ncbi:MAG: carboxylesterase family protein [Oscillospiraceae bacterium]
MGFTDHAKTIPVIVGTVMAEFGFGPGVPYNTRLTEGKSRRTCCARRFGDAAADTWRSCSWECYPEKNLTGPAGAGRLLPASPASDFARCNRRSIPKLPTYNYLFTYEFPMDDGKPAWHCSDIPFFFHNTDKVLICNIPGVSDQLEDRMASAWVNFARYGVPSCPSLPEWTPCKPGDVATMIFDRDCKVLHNFDDALYEAFALVAPQPFCAEEKRHRSHRSRHWRNLPGAHSAG